MKHGFLRRLVCCLWLGGAAAHAQDLSDPRGERERIARERAALEARFTESEAACQSRFAVTDCVNDAKAERREALAPLRRQAIALDDAQRKQRAAQRQENVRKKLSEARAPEREVVVRGAAAAASQPAAATSDEPASAPPRESKQKAAPKPNPARTPKAAPPAADRRAAEAQAQARLEERRRAAQAHREAVERRNAERALSGKRADPLPLPASAATR